MRYELWAVNAHPLGPSTGTTQVKVLKKLKTML